MKAVLEAVQEGKEAEAEANKYVKGNGAGGRNRIRR